MPDSMPRFQLLRRREVWLPTAWGWLALSALAAAAVVLALHSLHAFLSPNEPVGARVLVIEGWMDTEEMDQALAAARSGGYERVVTTGGPIERWKTVHRTYAELAADYLEHHGLKEAEVTPVPSPASAQDRTYLSAVMVRAWARDSGLALDALDVFSAGAHARRSRKLYRLAFGPEVRIGVLAARPSGYDAEGWWQTLTGVREVLDQALGLAWVTLFFHPPTETQPSGR